MKKCSLIIILLAAIVFPVNGQNEAMPGNLKLNEIQLIGSHNSYKEAIDPQLWDLIHLLEPKLANSLQYEHIALNEQLELGLRNLELDVYLEPEEARENNYERFDKAVESGAQIITTDYYSPSKLFKSGNHIAFKDGRFSLADNFLVNHGN